MIFSKNFDNTLWLMIRSDKKNRYDIIKLVSSIPKDLLDELNIFFHCGSLLKEKKIRKALRDSFGNTCLFDIYISDTEIKIDLSKWGLSDDCEEFYELNLKSISLDKELVFDTLDSFYIGSYFWRITKPIILFNEVVVITKCNMLSYELLDVSSSKIVIRLFDEYSKVKEISLEKIPDEIYLDDFKSYSKVKKLDKQKNGRF